MLSWQVTAKNKTPPLSNKAPQIIKPKFIWLSDRSKITKWVIPCSFYYKQCKQFVLTARTIAGWTLLSKVNSWYRTDSFCSCHILFGIYNIYFEIKLTWVSSVTTTDFFEVYMKTHFLTFPKWRGWFSMTSTWLYLLRISFFVLLNVYTYILAAIFRSAFNHLLETPSLLLNF